MTDISTTITRQIVLDTETTGMNTSGGQPFEGHRIIEIGAVEVINRRLTGEHFHVYIKPDRSVDPEAYEVHGISDEFLMDKPPFSEIADDFYQFIKGAELVIHNASFDVGFINHEFRLLKTPLAEVETFCTVTDTLAMARRLFPGKRNNLDALCDRYHIDNSRRTLHGALLDAEILAEVYLAMTGGQTSIAFANENDAAQQVMGDTIQRLDNHVGELKIVYATEQELIKHEERLDLVNKKGHCLWRN